MLPGTPEEAPAQGVWPQELFAPSGAGDHCPDLGGMDRLGPKLGVAQQGQDPVGADGGHPVQYILPPQPLEEDDVSFFHGTLGKVQENRVPGVQEGGHAGPGDVHGNMVMSGAQQLADGIEIAFCIEDPGHSHHLRERVGIL